MSHESSQPYLMLRDVDGNMSRIELAELPLAIGRRSQNDLQILDPTISRDHARIVCEGEDYVLEDLGSTHGTYVNQERVQRHILQPNDRIRLGGAMGHTLTFRSSDEFTLMVGTTGKVFDMAEKQTGTPAVGGDDVGAPNLRNITALLEISKALNSSLRLNDVLEKVMDAVIALTDAERGLLLLGTAADDLDVAVERNFTSDAESSRQYSQSVVREVFSTGESQILTDVAEDPRFSAQQSIVGLHLRTVMCVPLRLSHFSRDDADDLEEFQTGSPGGGEVRPSTEPVRMLGVLYVDRRSPTRHFKDQDLSIFESFAGHAAIAIDNARLYEEALEKRRMEEDLRVAYRIQKSLLLSDFPELPWADVHAINVPFRGVGGDYYEVFSGANGELGFAVGDVSGKGIPAAMLMAALQAAFLAATRASRDLSEVCATVNQFLVERTSPERYATFFAGLLEPSGKLRFVNAGHNPSLLFAGGDAQRLLGGGLPLGLFPNREYQIQEVQLDPDSLIVCYSDGVTEATDPQEVEFGEERLREVVSANLGMQAEAMNKAVFDAVEEFSQGTGQFDDLTLMVIRYEAPEAS